MSGEKNRPPTKKRLEEALKEGQVAQTPSIPHLLAAAGTFELIVATSDLWLSQAPRMIGTFLDRLGQVQADGQLAVADLVQEIAKVGAVAAIGALLFAGLMALIGNVLQTGIIVTPGGVARLDRLDPIAHLKNMLDTEQLLTLVMNVAKVTGILVCTGFGIAISMDSLLHVADGTLVQAAQALLKMFVLCERLSMLVLIVCVALDWYIRKESHTKQLRMSRQEVETEQKDQHGDKHVRGKRNEFRRDLLGGQLTENTRKSNAVVTNPTHFAVALLYDPAKYPLPVVLARGSDANAALMRRVAQQAGIPVIRSPQLARMLFSVGRERHPVPRAALKAVAAVYRVVAEIKSGERDPGDLPELG